MNLKFSATSSPLLRPKEFDIPAEATQDGEWRLSWDLAPRGRGNGHGCKIAEVWLLKKEDT